jgi:hypothetical protein
VNQNGLTPDKAAGTINDSLRYTMEIPTEGHTDRVKGIVKDMEKQGLTPVPNGDKNYWEHPDKMYKGLNFVMQDKEGFKYELQFHTKESYDTKSKIHGKYQEFRSPGTSAARKAELKAQMQAAWELVPVPKGIETIGRLMK